MKKKFKSILLFSSILGVGAITTGAIALTSCGSNVEDSVGSSGDQGSQLPPNNNQTGEGNSGSDSNTQVTPPSSQQPQKPILKPDQDQTPPSNVTPPNENPKPIITAEQREIIKNSPSLSYLYDNNKGARFILNNPNNITLENINTDAEDNNVHDLMTLCGFKSNMDPFLDNAYFANALTFTKVDVKAAEETPASTSVKVVEDPILSSKKISFYLYKNTTSDSGVVQTIAEQPVVDDVSNPDKWIKLGASDEAIKLEDTKNIYIALSFVDDITQSGYDVPQLFAENSDNSISSEYTFKNITGNNVFSRAADNESTPTKKLNKDTFLYQLNKKPSLKAADAAPITSNKIELVLKKKEDPKNPVTPGWRQIDSLTEGTIQPRFLQKEGSLTVGINQVVKAYTYTVLDKDTKEYTGYYSAQTITPTTKESSASAEKWFKVDDKSTNSFATNAPTPINDNNPKGNVNLYFLYTNGNNIDLNQLDVEAGTKLLLINNNPNKVSKVVCSNNSLEYGKGNPNGLQFNLGSSLGWYGRFEFTQLVKKGKPAQTKDEQQSTIDTIIGSNIKDFIFTNRNKTNYSLSTFSLSSLALEPTNKNL